MKLKLIALASTLLFTGCATTIPVTTYPVMDLGKSDNAESKNDEFRVIVTEIKSSHGSTATPDLSKAASGELSKIIQESGAREVTIDRGLRDKLETEFSLYEAEGRSDYTSPQAANLAITGIITNAVITSVYVPEPKRYDAKAEKMVVDPPECRYTAKVEGSLEFYSVNPVDRIDRVGLNGFENVTGPAHGQSCRDLSKNQTHILFLEAIHKAMNDAAADVKNKMASSGYVKLARKDPKTSKIYYRLSIKPSSGALPGVGVDFLETQLIDGQKEEFTFATGKVVCTNRSANSYAELETTGAENKIQVGTPVKLRFPDSGILYMLQKSLKAQGTDVEKMLPMLGCNP